ncbi:MAG TPA: diguanylate cyclase [Mobilitalea sp.]|nr:diguanylate cyclase [Mobilitalea sp.]
MEKARKIFIDEVKDRLPEALEAMKIISSLEYDSQAISLLYRFTHTLKGSSETIGIFEIAHPATEMNAALKLVQNYGVKLDQGIVDFLKERLDEIIDEIEYGLPEQNSAIKVPKSVNGKKLIYLIDDDVAVTSLVQEALLREGFHVLVFHDSKEAEYNIQIQRPDLIILDIILTTENEGIEFCHKLRSTEYSKLIPIIFLSRKNELMDKLKGFANGADDYVGKPFQVEELIARVQTILNRIEVQENLILTDELTKVYNRRYLDQRLLEETARAERTGNSLSIAMLDIDFFKHINDQYGHTAGDEVLQKLVDLLHKNLRASDAICRFGGEEFVIILPDTNKDAAYKLMERLRDMVEKNPVRLIRSNTTIDVTISIGIAEYGTDGTSSGDLIKSADFAMYRSKDLGRNSVTLAEGGLK